MLNDATLLACMDDLRRCDALATASEALARGAARLSGARAGIVYLFDHVGTELRRTAAHGESGFLFSDLDAEYAFSYENNPEDLLCFAIRKGEAHGAALVAGQSMPSVRPAQNSLPSVCGYWIAVPLSAAGRRIFGGVLLGFAKEQLLAESVAAFIRYGGVELALRNEGERQRSLEERLRDSERYMHESQTRPINSASLGIIANSPSMRAMLVLVQKASANAACVLLTGETGTGKSLIASCIHNLSERKRKPFVVANRAAIPDSLLESELFGHEKGAFAGADKASPGLLRNADGGSFFLDEIGGMPVALQEKLLRFLRERAVMPVGGTKKAPVDVKIITATNQDLLAAVEAGAFRRDLYHRLAVFPIAVPSLRERREDILPLAEHFIQRNALQQQRPACSLLITDSRRLQRHAFSGNVRELADLIERSFLLWPRGKPFRLAWDAVPRQGPTLADKVRKYERDLIRETLEKCNGSIREAALVLGLPRRTLAHKMHKFGLSEDKSARKAAGTKRRGRAPKKA